MKRNLILIVLLAVSTLGQAQIVWEKVNGPNDGVNAITATSNNELFLGTNNYGVYKSTDNGITWSTVMQGLSDTLIRHLGVSSTNEIFAGTATHGIYKYSGGSWTQINTGLYTTTISTMGFAGGKNGQMYMLATTDSVYKWNGATWTNIKFNLPALARAIVVGSDGSVYVGCFNNGVYKFDGNDTWTSLGAMPSSYVTKMTISKTDTIYVACNSNNIFRIPANGGTWTSINTGLPILNASMVGIDSANTLFLGYTNPSGYGEIYKSTNRGNTWSSCSGSLYTSAFLSFCATGNGYVYTGASGIYTSIDHGNSWIDMNPGLDARKGLTCFKAASDGTLLVGTIYSGVWRSTDNGVTWQQKNTGLTTTYSHKINTTAAGSIIYSAYIPGTTKKAVLFRSTNNGDTWAQVAKNGTDLYTQIVQHKTDTIWVAGRFGGPVLSYSIDDGATWVNHSIPSFSAVWDVEFGSGSSIFLGSESEGVTRSTDGGNSWTEGVGNTIPWYGNLFELEFDANGYLFAGTDWYKHYMWFSEPGSNGDVWTEFLDPDFQSLSGPIWDLVFDINNNAYLATNNGLNNAPIYMAVNSAWNENTDWIPLSNGLPSKAVAAEFGFDPEGYMYTAFFPLGREGGLYRSTLPVNSTITSVKNNSTNYLSVEIFPNPTSDLLTVSGTNFGAGNSKLAIKNSMGQILLSDNIFINNNTIQKTFSISSLSNGIYFLSIETDKLTILRRIIKN